MSVFSPWSTCTFFPLQIKSRWITVVGVFHILHVMYHFPRNHIAIKSLTTVSLRKNLFASEGIYVGLQHLRMAAWIVNLLFWAGVIKAKIYINLQ